MVLRREHEGVGRRAFGRVNFPSLEAKMSYLTIRASTGHSLCSLYPVLRVWAEAAPSHCGILHASSATPPLMATQEIWVGLRWSIGGGVASTRSEGVGPQRTETLRTPQAPPANCVLRHPRHADWAGRQRQSTTAAPSGAVEDRGRTMAINTQLRACGRRSPRGLDKKLLRLE